MSGVTDELRQRAEHLRSARRPYVTATVVRAEKPTSAKAGDSALVLDDGTVVGFVGGECAQTSVQVQALEAMSTGVPVLLRVSPDAPAPGDEVQPVESGVVTVHNPCLSGGALDIFLDPTVPPPLVLVLGDAPIAVAVRELAAWLGYDSRAWDADSPSPGAVPVDTAAVVVASHGAAEGLAIDAALRAGVPYVGLVASHRRGDAVLGDLGLSEAQRARVRTPAGVDIGARTPEEVALSILAEIVSIRPRPAPAAEPAAPPGAPVATDPVCGMQVAAVGTSRHLDIDGQRHWFCGSGCQDAFAASPGAFLRS